MTALDAGGSAQSAAAKEVVAEPAVTGLQAGDPLMLGLPTFIVGSFALGLALIGAQVPVGSFGAALAIVLAATAIGLFLSAAWAIAVGQSAVASILGIFSGFWGSLVVLVVAVDHNWFAFATPANPATHAPAANISVGAIELFLITWLIVIGMYTLATLRLPSAYTLILLLIDLALIFVLLGVSSGSTGNLKTAGALVIAFAAVGVYVFFSAASVATGGKPLPLGRPIIR